MSCREAIVLQILWRKTGLQRGRSIRGTLVEEQAAEKP